MATVAPPTDGQPRTSLPLRLVAAVVLLLCCVGCDQATKRLAVRALDNAPRAFLGGALRLELAYNPGGFLSLGANLPAGLRAWLFVGVNACFMLGMLAFLLLKRRASPWLYFSIVLVLAGGIGNLIDRATNDGFVIDFMNLGVGPLRTGVFNVADVAVSVGIVVMFWLSWRDGSAANDKA